MDDSRLSRIAAAVVEAVYPRLELKKMVKSEAGQEIQVWVVDGEYIRTYLDIEYTNFGQHGRFPFIPEFEFWLDKEGENDEADFFIAHLKVEWEAMQAGKPYTTAIVEADREEMKLRRKDPDIKKMIDPKRKLVDPKRCKKRLLKALKNGVKVYLVDGKLVRSVLDVDFTAGAHEFVYSWTPPGEVWIDNDIEWQERGYVILHELNERNLMEEGWVYDDAHANSSALELKCRKNPEELQDALIEVGWA